jgi:acyl-CoA thioesterase-1
MVRSVARRSVASSRPNLAVSRRRTLALGAMLATTLAPSLASAAGTAAAAAAAAPAAAAGVGPGSAGSRTLLVLGDSLSAEYGLPRGSGWVALLERRVAERAPAWRVVNASISGETSSGGRTRLPDLLARHRPQAVIVELGGNDALRGLPLRVTETNLSEMVRAAKQAGAKPLLVGMMMPPNYGRAYSEQFAAIYRRVAQAEKTALVPFLLEGFGEDVSFFQSDRIHPSQRAQPLMLDNVWPTLAPLLQTR